MYYRIIPQSDELLHYGVIGMHWGVRRYQDYNGKRLKGGSVVARDIAPNKMFRNTVAGGQGGKATGNARLAATAGGNKKSAIDVIAGPEVKKGKGKDNSSHLKEIAQDVGNAAEGLGKVSENMKKHDKGVQEAQEKANQSQRQKAKQMSDKELRDSINRIKMEREYVSLTTKEVETGYDKFKDIMGEVKDVAVTAAAVAGLVLTIIKIKNSLGAGHSAIGDDDMDELRHYLSEYDFDADVVEHALDLDLDYILEHFDISEDDLNSILDEEDYLEHHGIKGMHWGIRRFQNYDGTRIGTGHGVGGGGGGSSASDRFRNSIAGGQGGKATGNARLAATANKQQKSAKTSTDSYNGPVGFEYKTVSGRTVKAFRDKPTYRPEPEGYSLKRQLEEDRLKKAIQGEKDYKRKSELSLQLKQYANESKKLANDYLSWESEVKKYVGNTREYEQLIADGKKTQDLINKGTGRIITNKEYWTAGKYDTIPFWKR